MENILHTVFIQPFQRFLEKITGFLPQLLTGIVLFITGFIIAWFFRTLVTKLAELLKFDTLSERIGLGQMLQKTGIREPFSRIMGKLFYWIILISFITMGLEALKVPAVERLLAEFLLYLPNVIVAAVILILGYLLGNFLGRAALIAAVNAGLSVAQLLGKCVKFTVFIMAVTMALELLGIGKDTVLIAFAIIFGGVVLALAIAFGHGGKKAAEDYIEEKLKKKEKKDEISHI